MTPEERVDVVLVYPQRAPAQGRHWIMPSLGLMYLSASLRRAGYSVDEAEDGRSALSHLQTREVDLLLLDLQLPGMSGFEILGYLQKHRRGLPALSDHPRRTKAGASSTHSIRFATPRRQQNPRGSRAA